MCFPLPLPPAELAHCRRTAALSQLLAGLADCSEPEVRTITQSAFVHDIGKAAIPPSILYKPGPLSSDERKIIQTHTAIGAQALARTRGTMRTAAVVALQHHERLDGSGYLGLRSSEIHPHARLVAVADVVDALIFPRAYKQPWGISRIRTYLTELADVELDGDIVRLLLDHMEQVLALYPGEIRINRAIHIQGNYTHRGRRNLHPCFYRRNSTSFTG